MSFDKCPCGSEQAFADCCETVIRDQSARTAEQLMRSRYTAYQTGDIAYLGESLHPQHREDWDEAATARWAKEAEWQKLEIVATEEGTENDEQGMVEFVAWFKEKDMLKKHHELSRFKKQNGKWYYVSGELPKVVTQRNEQPKQGRNDPCRCGSGKKYKKCCGR